MAENDASAAPRSRFWDNLIIPIVVGLTLFLGGYLGPKILDAGKRLSYTIEAPDNLNADLPAALKLQFAGSPPSDIFVTKVRIWNSGSAELKDVHCIFEFKTQNHNFKLLHVGHSATQGVAFHIDEKDDADNKSTELIYPYLNRHDEDTISFLTNGNAELSLTPRIEGLDSLVQVKPARNEPTRFNFWWVAAVLGVFGSLLGMFIRWVFSDIDDEWWARVTGKPRPTQ